MQAMRGSSYWEQGETEMTINSGRESSMAMIRTLGDTKDELLNKFLVVIGQTHRSNIYILYIYIYSVYIIYVYTVYILYIYTSVNYKVCFPLCKHRTKIRGLR